MTRKEIPFNHGFAGQCAMCKIAIKADESRVAVYDDNHYLGMYCPTCAKISREEDQEPKEHGPASDIERIIDIYDSGMQYAAKKKIKVSSEDMMKAAITVFIGRR